jgi:hypothetical protein
MGEPSDRGTSHRPRRTGVTLPRGKSLIALAACACAVVAGALVAATASGGPPARVTGAGGRSTAPSAPAAQLGTGPPGQAGAGSGTSDGIAGTALRWPAGLQTSMQRWNAGPGGAALSAVTRQLANAMQAAGVGLYPEARQGCSALRSSVRTAQAAPPIPYAAMQKPYQGVLARLSSAAVDCQNAISVRPDGDEGTETSLNKALLNHSLSELAAGSKALYTATARIRALHA